MCLLFNYIHILWWRVFPPVCPSPLSYTTCLRQCLYCDMIESECSEMTLAGCTPGCECAHGMMYNGTHCVAPSECSCRMPGGEQILRVWCDNVLFPTGFWTPRLIFSTSLVAWSGVWGRLPSVLVLQQRGSDDIDWWPWMCQCDDTAPVHRDAHTVWNLWWVQM